MANRFRTTHTDSLPRPDHLARMMFARGEGVPVDAVALDQAGDAAVAEMVACQDEAGIDIVGDGKMSKPSYATCTQDRLTGFGGKSAPICRGSRRL